MLVFKLLIVVFKGVCVDFQRHYCDFRGVVAAFVFQEISCNFQGVAATVVFQEVIRDFQWLLVLLFFKKFFMIIKVFSCCCFSRSYL
jgi:hypothetical protein